MRLLNSYTDEIREFITDDCIPPYAILSHTWADEEVTFRDRELLPAPAVEAKQRLHKDPVCVSTGRR